MVKEWFPSFWICRRTWFGCSSHDELWAVISQNTVCEVQTMKHRFLYCSLGYSTWETGTWLARVGFGFLLAVTSLRLYVNFLCRACMRLRGRVWYVGCGKLRAFVQCGPCGDWIISWSHGHVGRWQVVSGYLSYPSLGKAGGGDSNRPGSQGSGQGCHYRGTLNRVQQLPASDTVFWNQVDAESACNQLDHLRVCMQQKSVSGWQFALLESLRWHVSILYSLGNISIVLLVEHGFWIIVAGRVNDQNFPFLQLCCLGFVCCHFVVPHSEHSLIVVCQVSSNHHPWQGMEPLRAFGQFSTFRLYLVNQRTFGI